MGPFEMMHEYGIFRKRILVYIPMKYSTDTGIIFTRQDIESVSLKVDIFSSNSFPVSYVILNRIFFCPKKLFSTSIFQRLD